MNNFAFIFKNAPHGNTSGREGLDVLLAISTLNPKIGIFFIADGVFIPLLHQKPEQILSKNFIITFNLLSLFNIKNIYLCSHSAIERGLDKKNSFILNIKWLTNLELSLKIKSYKIIFTF